MHHLTTSSATRRPLRSTAHTSTRSRHVLPALGAGDHPNRIAADELRGLGLDGAARLLAL